MKKKMRFVSRIIIVVAILLFVGCKSNHPSEDNTKQEVTEVIPGEADLLLEYLFESGDYVNSRLFPSMIKPETVFENLSSNMHIIDMRFSETFAKGISRVRLMSDFKIFQTIWKEILNHINSIR